MSLPRITIRRAFPPVVIYNETPTPWPDSIDDMATFAYITNKAVSKANTSFTSSEPQQLGSYLAALLHKSTDPFKNTLNEKIRAEAIRVVTTQTVETASADNAKKRPILRLVKFYSFFHNNTYNPTQFTETAKITINQAKTSVLSAYKLSLFLAALTNMYVNQSSNNIIVTDLITLVVNQVINEVTTHELNHNTINNLVAFSITYAQEISYRR